MRILKRGRRPRPRVSVVLLDWSVRESFHLLHYLKHQDVPRESFEVLVVEYYSRQSVALAPFIADVDTWILLEVPERCYYHKHLMYNAGIVFAKGEILIFCDSDAMARPTFLGEVVRAFDRDPGIVLHLDQFRNARRDFYPFNYPSFEAVLGPGCINNQGGRTTGVVSAKDPLHERNYGACMCARRDALIEIGGSDEHIDYLGHVCGPYEMTFRLVNSGRREVWHQSEFLYHTWHPGQAGADNYLGPHDGRHMSTTALQALITGRVRPYVSNAAVEVLRTSDSSAAAAVEALVVRTSDWDSWALGDKRRLDTVRPTAQERLQFDYRGYRVGWVDTGFEARLILDAARQISTRGVLVGSSGAQIRRAIDREIGVIARMFTLVGGAYILFVRLLSVSGVMARRALRWLGPLPGRVWRATVMLVRRTTDRVRRFRFERTQLSGSLSSLIVNLHALPAIREADSGDRYIVLVGTAAEALYVKLLSRAGVLPKVPVVLVRPADVAFWIGQLRGTSAVTRPIVARGLYVLHHAAFSAAGLTPRLIVV